MFLILLYLSFHMFCTRDHSVLYGILHSIMGSFKVFTESFSRASDPSFYGICVLGSFTEPNNFRYDMGSFVNHMIIFCTLSISIFANSNAKNKNKKIEIFKIENRAAHVCNFCVLAVNQLHLHLAS
jgi:hypothetical protein